jgi:hypothetical protein
VVILYPGSGGRTEICSGPRLVILSDKVDWNTSMDPGGSPLSCNPVTELFDVLMTTAQASFAGPIYALTKIESIGQVARIR